MRRKIWKGIYYIVGLDKRRADDVDMITYIMYYVLGKKGRKIM